MARKGALFDLIKSMTRTEKRYFRLFAARENTVYLALFSAIEKQDEYDEGKIREQFSDKKFTRQLHVAKNYLASLVMRALRNYHARSSVKAEVLDLLRDAEIHLARELYSQCENTLTKAETLARDHEYLPLLLEAFHLRRSLELARGSGHGSQLASLLNAERATLAAATHLNTMWQFTPKLFEHTRKKDFLENKAIAEKGVHGSIRSETLRRHVRYSWYFMNGDQKNAEKEVDALLAMLEKQRAYVSEEPGAYVTALGNKISMLLNARRHKETGALLEQMRNVPVMLNLKKNSRFTVRLWLRLFNLELEFYRDSDQPERSQNLIKEIATFLSEHERAVPAVYVLLFRFQFALVHYSSSNLRACLKEINGIINANFEKERPDIQCGARLLNLVVHYELGNILVLRYIVDSTQRFLMKHKAFGEPRKVLLALFKKLSRAEKSDHRKLFRSALKRYRENGSPDHFDFARWMAEKAA